MINRILIRIKVLQIVYSFYQNGNNDLKVAENELLFSLRKSYDLYHYFLLLIIEVTNLQRRTLDAKKCKYMPTHAELNPNTRLVDNRFAAQVAENEALQKYVAEQGLSWVNDEEFVKNVLDIILASDLYNEYLDNENDSYETDKEFWRAVFKKLICGNEQIEEFLEDKSIYWNDDIGIVETFTLKTIKQFEEKSGSKQKLLPMFKDMEDQSFAIKLFRQSLLKGSEYRERINKHMKNWEAERIANMDLIIMQVALAEIMTFPTIPINVTLNEYIDTAKYYSTPKSGVFINGILDSIVSELKKEKVLLKD
ncbi:MULTISPECIES: transcription antitermination factor NusB [Parabacteroides]|jgi:transcription antitermination factor nusB|nr:MULTISPECIES: transcription antitermination factor NusB [Parabacteroides]MBC8619999.1 transcription antitermination factor NusB [Parabacteroides faecis]MCS2892093.1 transcription antitermination factor NusB [Parabacteroides faecis]RHR40877.1 transcription antitermination factor NusB [Parabacteroides sp. AF18-52]RHR98788.1 transcription antitermination factor NusB [Parabacteroides sp. AF14-59]GGK10157.1 N utilization substance protein B [Parabacteroides faecis]